jgi:uncharacterized membrane protein YgdD (TMEM256/DUF423 family)
MGGGGGYQNYQQPPPPPGYGYQQQPPPGYGYQQQPPPGYLTPQGGYAYPPPPFGGQMAGDGMWRDGTRLVVYSHGVSLPDRCVKCNAPANGFQLRRKLYWHPPAWYLLILVHLIIYFIVSLIIRKSAEVHVGLCETHQSRRRTMLITGWLLFAAGILGFVMAGVVNDGTPAGLGGLLFLAGLIVLIIAARVVVPAKIDDRFAWLKGVHSDYLAQLPPWPGWS